ncbi:Papain inhibitor [Smittium culicis]|uniref:Papain inhibitor n=1 Tax=Smittium culicis TaxID=133412 RepID=A0A1R1Y0T8_9FUNG|nr:Papain inhibitor [Smittium culicis]
MKFAVFALLFLTSLALSFSIPGVRNRDINGRRWNRHGHMRGRKHHNRFISRPVAVFALFTRPEEYKLVTCDNLKLANPENSEFCGSMTHYSTGLGACGERHNDNDLVAAVNTSQYGGEANPNLAGVCGKCILIKNHLGASVKVRAVDKCPECAYGDLDLSPAAFKALAPLFVGRFKASWRFVSCT